MYQICKNKYCPILGTLCQMFATFLAEFETFDRFHIFKCDMCLNISNIGQSMPCVVEVTSIFYFWITITCTPCSEPRSSSGTQKLRNSACWDAGFKASHSGNGTPMSSNGVLDILRARRHFSATPGLASHVEHQGSSNTTAWDSPGVVGKNVWLCKRFFWLLTTAKCLQQV